MLRFYPHVHLLLEENWKFKNRKKGLTAERRSEAFFMTTDNARLDSFITSLLMSAIIIIWHYSVIQTSLLCCCLQGHDHHDHCLLLSSLLPALWNLASEGPPFTFCSVSSCFIYLKLPVQIPLMLTLTHYHFFLNKIIMTPTYWQSHTHTQKKSPSPSPTFKICFKDLIQLCLLLVLKYCYNEYELIKLILNSG